MITWNTLSGDTSWPSNSTQTYNNLVFQMLFELELPPNEDDKNLPHLDTATPPIPTIGIGFNLVDSQVRGAVLATMNLSRYDDANGNSVNPTLQIENLIINTTWGPPGSTHDSSYLRTQLNAIMAAAYAAGHANRSTFRLEDSEMRSVFDVAVVENKYETKIDNWLGGIQTSRERAVLFSLAYNTKSGDTDLLGDGLEAAIIGSDRAEAWYEIRYNSNLNASGGIAKRRYLESHIFGLYNALQPTAGDLAEQDALNVFRMFNKHERKIRSYDQQYSGWIDDANGNLTDIETASG